MARYSGPVCRLCRREGSKLFLKGSRCLSDKCAIERRNYPPGQHGRRRGRRPSDYQVQLREKQKVKRIYGVFERQFRKYFKEAAQRRGITGEALLIGLERRLDNVVYRTGLALSRAHARQIVRHGHIQVNGGRVDIPSYQTSQGDVIAVAPGSKKNIEIKMAAENATAVERPNWLQADLDSLEGRVVQLPTRADLDIDIQEQLIVELYSK
ncbi:MAG TPA: 30S ribosomal protein S4 [Acidobacteriota bacterium]|nr:30S ribosomal protein S4 [Acidobacteriota bacterium]MCS5703741.1 30S ribosomal protein S4 [Acidobacteriota bacterium]MED5559422.1 30S ribosomal protein S4 [Acidobacteriota bacterium]HJN48512.1 30S ribosomal protein S4 [Acidobacteriota bacterium]